MGHPVYQDDLLGAAAARQQAGIRAVLPHRLPAAGKTLQHWKQTFPKISQSRSW